MSYLKDFEKLIIKKDFSKILELWEEYCSNDEVDTKELIAFLKVMKKSDLASSFGPYVEQAIPLWQTVEDLPTSYEVLKQIMDLQTTNTPVLAEAAFQLLKAKHDEDDHFHERIRLIGLRTRENFQGAISNFDLLSHMDTGKFVFHTGGWGCGEIMDYSTVREQIAIEFENVGGLKHFTFTNAFKALEPLPEGHFLVKRFGDPDAFEEESRKDPVGAIRQLLVDLGPKTAAEIKDEMCELVIPEKDWTKWWQSARAKLKKDPLIQTPKSIRDPFYIRESEMTSQELLDEEIHGKEGLKEIIVSSYNLIRDVPKQKKNQEVYETVQAKLKEVLNDPEITPSQRLQVALLLDQFFGESIEGVSVDELIKDDQGVVELIQGLDIVALKKRAFAAVRKCREDWVNIYLSLLLSESLAQTRDAIYAEIKNEAVLKESLSDLLKNPTSSPETVAWYFQKLYAKRKGISDEDLCQWFAAFLVALHHVEHNAKQRDLTKKIVQFISSNHFKVLRDIFEKSDITWAKEILLLLSKCMIFEEGEQKIFRSLAQVVHPTIEGKEKPKEKYDVDIHVFWTSEHAYSEARQKAQQIGTVEMVENAEEVKRARELGDLRENAEYKAACEKRRRLQHDLRVLSDQINRARIITPDDINADNVGVGSVVSLKKGSGGEVTYTILGPWDADVDKGILSIQSRFAQSMLGRKVGDHFTFLDEEYTVNALRSFLESKK